MVRILAVTQWNVEVQALAIQLLPTLSLANSGRTHIPSVRTRSNRALPVSVFTNRYRLCAHSKNRGNSMVWVWSWAWSRVWKPYGRTVIVPMGTA